MGEKQNCLPNIHPIPHSGAEYQLQHKRHVDLLIEDRIAGLPTRQADPVTNRAGSKNVGSNR